MPWHVVLPYAFEAVLESNLFVTLPSQIAQNRHGWTRACLSGQHPLCGLGPEKALVRQRLASPLAAASFELCEDPLEHLRPVRQRGIDHIEVTRVLHLLQDDLWVALLARGLVVVFTHRHR